MSRFQLHPRPMANSAMKGSIVLYLCIYIALLAVHTNQKRFQKFQCERPREKRAVLREQKEAVGSPVNNVIRMTAHFDGKMRPRVRRLAIVQSPSYTKSNS